MLASAGFLLCFIHQFVLFIRFLVPGRPGWGFKDAEKVVPAGHGLGERARESLQWWGASEGVPTPTGTGESWMSSGLGGLGFLKARQGVRGFPLFLQEGPGPCSFNQTLKTCPQKRQSKTGGNPGGNPGGGGAWGA